MTKNSELLVSQLQHVCRTVPYYRERFNNSECPNDVPSIHNFPLLGKEDVVRNEGAFISDNYASKYQTGDLLLKRTSGSTGKCMNVYWLPSDYYLSNIEAWRYRSKWYGVSIKDRYAKFHSTLYINGTVDTSPKSIIIKGQTISFDKMNLNEESIHTYIGKMNEFKPSWMTIQPSVLHALISCATPNELHILNSFKYIEFISEFLHPNTLEHFKKMLPNVNFGDLYGTTETGCISLKCPCGNHHILNNVYVEIFDDNYTGLTDGEGKIVLTSLRNSAMPLIRYCIGDRGKILYKDCACGYKGFDISLTLGREYDIIELPNGEKRHSSVFWQIIEEVLFEYPESITQFFITQEKLDLMTFHLSISDKYRLWHMSIEESLRNAFGKFFSKDLNCQVYYDCDNLAGARNKNNIYTRLE